MLSRLARVLATSRLARVLAASRLARVLATSRLARVLAMRTRPGIPVETIVDAVFEAVLLRPPDAASRSAYSRALGRGLSVGEVVAAVHTSDEAVANSWRSPVVAGLGPALYEAARRHSTERPIYVCAVPGGAGAELAGMLTGMGSGAGRVFLHGLDLDQLLWVPDVVLGGAALVSGPLGTAILDRLPPDAVSACVLDGPVDGAAARPLLRLLAAEADLDGAWWRYRPEPSLQGMLEEAGRRVEEEGGEGEVLRRARDRLGRFSVVGDADDLAGLARKVAAAAGWPEAVDL
jgi:hypothetical protein